ncbi:MAG: hypothetical protein JWP57_694 [Spirosoma sp.]|nr:hypothetical protein [Spirosoma sp.]
MDVKDFLKTNKDINLSELAQKMWPNNKSAKTYLSRKINGERPFTRKDAELAKRVLGELGVTLTSLTVADKY